MTLVLPIAASATLIVLAMVAVLACGRSKQSGNVLWRVLAKLNSPVTWTLHIWVLLILYPMLCSKVPMGLIYQCVHCTSLLFAELLQHA